MCSSSRASKHEIADVGPDALGSALHSGSVDELDAKWAHICQTSKDEDEVADYGNDLIELRLTLKSVKEKAIAAFGPGVANFDRAPL